MQDFIVLGLVPGTQIQLTFMFWVIVAAVVIGLPLLYALIRLALVGTHRFTHAIDEAEFILP